MAPPENLTEETTKKTIIFKTFNVTNKNLGLNTRRNIEECLQPIRQDLT